MQSIHYLIVMEKFTKKIILLVALTLGLIYGVNGQASNTYYYIGGPTGSVDFTSTSWVLAANYTSGSAMTAVAPSVVNATVVFIIDASDVGPASGAQLGTNITLSLGGARTIGQLIIRNNNVPVTISGTGSLLIGGATTAQIPGAELDLGTGCSLNINNSGTVGSIISTSNVCGGATIENLMVNNNAGVTVASGANMVNVTEALKLVVGQMTTNGNVTIISTALNQGYIDDFSGSNAGTLSGNIKVERYITNGPNGFRYIGAPVYNNVNGLSLSGVVGPAFPVQGTPGQAIPQGTCSFNNSPTNLASNSPYATFMRWNEPGPFTNFCRQQGWYFQTSGDMTLGRGYGAKLAGGSKLTYTGAANTGAITYAPCTHTDVFVNASPSTPTYDGWNLVSNPFPSNIEISSIPGDGDPNNNMPAGFDGQIQFYQTTGQFTGTYLTYNVGTQVAPIALGQGFWADNQHFDTLS
ncbi:unnamed protein product [Rotaria sordida]|uniref:Uncharacterized protein n=1 Tax=Rotaria sordida TaxID=392033 RepID=A0A813RXW9_9BILA|nr:unnamed protein product [Rotaria sordida]